MTVVLDQRLRARLAELRSAGLQRNPPHIAERRGTSYELGGRRVVGFCSNDYLGLADLHLPALDVPSGASASRLVAGDLPAHRELEARLAALARTEDAVLFPSGFQANVGALPALVQPTDTVFSDALNHASLIDGLRLSRARVVVLAHGTAPDDQPRPGVKPGTGADAPARNELDVERPRPMHSIHPSGERRAEDEGPADALRWWITESIFSMDGDRADTAALSRHLADGGALYVDEAHAFGLFPGCGGLTGAAGLRPTVLLATLSKALGCAGGFIGASRLVCHWLRTRARSFVFSTGTSPVLVHRIAHALDVATGPEGEARRERLWSNAHRLARHLGDPHPPPSPIFPLLVRDNHAVTAIASDLLELGWHVQPIRPPTVPRDGARLRVTVTALHSAAEIDALVRDLHVVFRRHGRAPILDRGPSPRFTTSATDQDP